MTLIKFRRGNKADLATSAPSGMPLWCEDTKELYVGTGTGIKLVNDFGSLISIPTGTVVWFSNSTAPNGFVKCNGSALSRTTYTSLFTTIGTTFGVGDSTTTFNVPDLRAEFIRGWDDSRNIDTARVFGSAQAELVGPHSTNLTLNHIGGCDPGVVQARWGLGNTTWGAGTSTTVVKHTTAENRPRNVALLACIKY